MRKKISSFTYAIHGSVDELDVVKAKGPMHETLAATRLATIPRTGEERGWVTQEQYCCNNQRHVHECVPSQHKTGPNPREQREVITRR